MHIKKAFIKKGTGGHLEELVRGLLPKNTDYAEVQDDVIHHKHTTHTHLTDEILHVLEGSIYFYTEGGTTLCEAGDCMALPKNTVHSPKPGPNGCTYVISILKEYQK
ncbi:cupin domain-containing protein [Bacillus songklensis]|uniref:Cupin domain-containing protein n=1 Tax=Bacillus songklensis TaxID=1069116 RepID=A0ABV8B9E4_9BACI